jgi:hypothetical protein
METSIICIEHIGVVIYWLCWIINAWYKCLLAYFENFNQGCSLFGMLCMANDGLSFQIHDILLTIRNFHRCSIFRPSNTCCVKTYWWIKRQHKQATFETAGWTYYKEIVNEICPWPSSIECFLSRCIQMRWSNIYMLWFCNLLTLKFLFLLSVKLLSEIIR